MNYNNHKFSWLISIFLTPFILWAADIEFFKEEINFEIKEDYFYIDGIYQFQNSNSKPIKQILFYPFPADNFFGKVDNMVAQNLSDSLSVLVKEGQKGFTFVVDIPSKSISSYRLSYRHKLFGNKAKYILLSTSSWKKPLIHAKYSFTCPTELQITEFSYIPDEVKVEKGKQIFFWDNILF